MTLARARRQVWTRWLIGGLLIILAVVFLILALLKHIYLTLPGLFFPAWGAALHQFIAPILRDSAVLSLLWHVIPTWQLPPPQRRAPPGILCISCGAPWS